MDEIIDAKHSIDSNKIGDKILLCENITRVLVMMKCPYSLEPHQIQGLDYSHILPVLQWLGNRVREVRKIFGDENRGYGIIFFELLNF